MTWTITIILLGLILISSFPKWKFGLSNLKNNIPGFKNLDFNFDDQSIAKNLMIGAVLSIVMPYLFKSLVVIFTILMLRKFLARPPFGPLAENYFQENIASK